MNPYSSLASNKFWRPSVAERDYFSISQVWTPKFKIQKDAAIITAGSCFSQNMGKELQRRGMNWHNAEPAPDSLSAQEAFDHNYGVFSFRTGNIYTARLLLQWLQWAFDEVPQSKETWNNGERYFDPFRPNISPDGFESPQAMWASREDTLVAIRKAISSADLFVFTMGLTEAWLNTATNVVYPMCPGTVKGRFDERLHQAHNFAFAEILSDFQECIDLIGRHNPNLRLVFTVSPVPVTATFTTHHVLTASTYTKSVLRAVAGQLEATNENVEYFPSYELVASPPMNGVFYNPNKRTITPTGVRFVMGHFFNGISSADQTLQDQSDVSTQSFLPTEDIICEEELLDYYK
ncbi:GSCFA family protein [Pseudovibrio axinellae]|uniref:GSCFA family protein n=1 Tax=Pseudovibrio axinellae TaxID=989403 RepID=A0A165WRA4_9HYPH|nr:GSCFA domain-containing protein [Pseudovibrio axinellae]KZL16806.1 GSCFA family protein [Pseudovibrio axinellae]SER68526.1 GSCFA family protein [Pseudovibrio axinellae]